MSHPYPSHRYWPLRALRIRTPRLELRLPDGELLDELAAVAADGVHAPDRMPFLVPWTDGEPDEVGRATYQHVLGTVAGWTAQDWTLSLAVLHEGKVVGRQDVMGQEFGVRREVLTGSWLGLPIRGRASARRCGPPPCTWPSRARRPVRRLRRPDGQRRFARRLAAARLPARRPPDPGDPRGGRHPAAAAAGPGRLGEAPHGRRHRGGARRLPLRLRGVAARAGRVGPRRTPPAPSRTPPPPPHGTNRRRWEPWRPIPRSAGTRHPAREPARHRDRLARLG